MGRVWLARAAQLTAKGRVRSAQGVLFSHPQDGLLTLIRTIQDMTASYPLKVKVLNIEKVMQSWDDYSLDYRTSKLEGITSWAPHRLAAKP